MCGRARLSSDVSEIKLVFRIPPEQPTPNFAASWNVAPTDPLPVVRYDAKDHQRSLEVMRWGLIPYSGRRTSRSASRPSMRPPRRSAPSRRFVKRSGNGAASCHWTIFANGRRPRPANSLMRSGSRAAGSWAWPAYGRLGARRRANWPVSARVGNVKNNDPSLIEPIAAVG